MTDVDGISTRVVILLAGVGSRLGALTDATPKPLLPIGGEPILDRMIGRLDEHRVRRLVLVCGHMQETIERHLDGRFPGCEVTVVRNAHYRTTNTGASLLCARAELEGETFVKLDGDVVFDDEILTRLLAAPSGASYACVDTSAVDDEVIKVQSDDAGRIVRIGNEIPAATATGESIGIERIDGRSSRALFAQLEAMAADPAHRQSYYEVAYDALVRAGEPFRALDVTGLRWVEIDTPADYELAGRAFGVVTGPEAGSG